MCITAASCPADEKKAPLYRDEAGWMIASTRDCEDLVGKAFDVANKLDRDLADMAPAFDYMAFHEPEKFYGIVLIVPAGMVTYWPGGALITMEYIYDDRTYSVESQEFIIASARQEHVIHSFEIEGFVPIPNPAYEIFQTGNGNPVIFAKFPLPHTPDKIVGFNVANVKSKRR
jgi:hypothetical protein